MAIVLSHIQAEALLNAYRMRQFSVITSLDLGLSTSSVKLSVEGVTFPDGQQLSWAHIAEIIRTENACFRLEANSLQKIQAFSEETNRFCSLMPTTGAPTLLIAGFPMHRIKNTDPYRDTLSKIKAIAPVSERVLDTTTGLGYTAIEASRTAQEVITVELDPTVLEIARQNPWSANLFNSSKISQLVGDSSEVITEFPNGAFTHIVHDPPTFSLAGELYSGVFYRELFRVLRRGGRLFHYIGDLDSQLGHRVAKGAIQRLKEAGFANAKPYPLAFGIVASK
jgi:predicted methyltransferase